MSVSQTGATTGHHRVYQPPLLVIYGNSVMSTQLVEASLLRVGTVFRFERDALPVVKILTAMHDVEYTPPSPPTIHVCPPDAAVGK